MGRWEDEGDEEDEGEIFKYYLLPPAFFPTP
jgi:hypothetical protein